MNENKRNFNNEPSKELEAKLDEFVRYNSNVNTTDIIEYALKSMPFFKDDNVTPEVITVLTDKVILLGLEQIDMNKLKTVEGLAGTKELKSLGHYVGMANDVSTASKSLIYSKHLDNAKGLLKKINELEASGDNDSKDIKILKRKYDDELKEAGKSLLGSMSGIASHIPGLGMGYSAIIISKASNLLEDTANDIIKHYDQIDEALNYFERVLGNNSNGTLTETDITNMLKAFPEIEKRYKDMNAIYSSDILKCLPKDKQKHYTNIMQEATTKYKNIPAIIGKLNKKLTKLGEEVLSNEMVDNVYEYTNEEGAKFVRKGKQNAKQSYDPLVIDLDNDGFDMKKIENGVYFDLDKNGFKEKTSWVDKKDGTYATSSIDALASYDENNDGIIDKNDKIFDELLVWQDINGDGISYIDELKKLSEYNISSINLNERQSYGSKINDSTLKNIITYTKIDDENKIKGKIGEFLLEKDNIDVITEDLLNKIDESDIENKELAEKIKKLPNIRAFGRVNTLHNEMFLDKTGQLIKLVEQFSREESMDKKDEILDNILIKMGKAESIQESERGQYINGKYVKVLENLFDEELEKGQLNQRRADFYKGSYNNIKQMYYAMLTIQTKFKEIEGLFSIKDNKIANIDLLNY